MEASGFMGKFFNAQNISLRSVLQVGGEFRPTVVATVYVEAAVDLDPGPARQVGEVGPPLANRVGPT